MTHANAPLTPAGRLRLVQRCEHRPEGLSNGVCKGCGITP